MPRVTKAGLKKVLAELNTACTACGYSIPPNEMMRIDSERMRCPRCGEKFAPGERK
jgi:predicted RNA-binding Zn-ribbon protein involved in translation (DUF1610 family)